MKPIQDHEHALQDEVIIMKHIVQQNQPKL